MSLYIGKDNSGVSILHTTNSLNDFNTIKSGVNSSTMFHSSLPYIQQKYIENVTTYRSAYWAQQYYSYSFTLQLSNTLIDLINQGYVFSVILATSNSGGVRTSLSFCSTFNKTTPPLSNVEEYSNSQYSYGPNTDSMTWGSSRMSYPSYTNRFMYLYNADYPSSTILASSQYNGGPDSIINDTATILIYNMKISGNLDINHGVNQIVLNRNQFTISGSLGTINLATFSPVRISSSYLNGSFKNIYGNIYVVPYTSSLISPVSSWKINSINSSSVKISKIDYNGIEEVIVGNGNNNLVLVSTQDVWYNLYTNKNTSIFDTGIYIGNEEIISIFNNGNFNNGLYPNGVTSGLNIILTNGGSSTLCRGYTYRSDNGTEIYGYYYLVVYIESNYLKVKAISQNSTNRPMDGGIFSGVLKIIRYRYN